MFTNYKYIITGNKVIALSTYAGRTVKGIAKCHPSDKFDVEYGKELAAARCNQKIAKKRYERARVKYWDMCKEIKEVNARAQKVSDYLKDAAVADRDATLYLIDVRSKINDSKGD